MWEFGYLYDLSIAIPVYITTYLLETLYISPSDVSTIILLHAHPHLNQV